MCVRGHGKSSSRHIRVSDGFDFFNVGVLLFREIVNASVEPIGDVYDLHRRQSVEHLVQPDDFGKDNSYVEKLIGNGLARLQFALYIGGAS